MKKDLFKAIQNYRIYINRFCRLNERDEMLDFKFEAYAIIRDFDEEYGLTDCMKKFLFHRIYQAAYDTGLM